jgi:hypothetical protein
MSDLLLSKCVVHHMTCMSSDGIWLGQHDEQDKPSVKFVLSQSPSILIDITCTSLGQIGKYLFSVTRIHITLETVIDMNVCKNNLHLVLCYQTFVNIHYTALPCTFQPS